LLRTIYTKRVFGPKRDEVTGEWRKLHNEELRDLYSSPSIIRIIKSRRMAWAGHVARMGEMDLGSWILDLGEVGWVMWTALVWLRIETGGELL
jgi:hypothetical protein